MTKKVQFMTVLSIPLKKSMSEIEEAFDEKTRRQDPSTVRRRSRDRASSHRPRTGAVRGRSKSRTFSDQSILADPEQWESINEKELFQAGTIIRDNYCLKEKIGEGGMGVVWKAVDSIQVAGDSRDVYVAIKFLTKDYKQDPNALKALVREFARYKRLIHSNIVKAYELSRVGDIIFIVMEFLEGIPLEEFIKQHPNGVPLSQAEPIIRGMGEALAYAHQQDIAHLDFKPDNVFYDPNKGVTKVIDFGIAQFIEVSEREKTRFKVSELRALTEAYASCEMLADLEPKPHDDIYALACVTYELLSGKHPFNKTRADQARLSKELFPPKPLKGLENKQYKALLRALAFEQENRTPTVKEFLEEFLLSKPIFNKFRLAIAAGGIFVLLSLAVFVAFLVRTQDSSLTECISRSDEACIKTLEISETETQADILRGSQVKKGLINFYIRQTHGDVIHQLEVFDSVIQKTIFGDPLVKETLIAHYVTQIDHELKQEHFDQALALLKSIQSKYDDSKILSDKLQEIEQTKRQRLRTEFTSADKARIESALGWADEALRLEVLESAEVRKALLSYYMDESNIKAQNKDFPKAFQVLDDALNIFSAYPKAKDALTSHKGQLKEFKEKGNEGLLNALQAKYQQYLSVGKWLPDDSGEGIVDVLAQIKNIDPNYSLLKDAELHQAFDRKIRQLVSAKGDTTLQIKDLFQAWKSLLHFRKPDEETLQHAMNFVWLFYRKKGFEAKDRGDKENAIKYFLYILELDWEKEVNSEMAKEVEDALAEFM
jgi:serine/threonine protein kinase